ncbi:5-bromo-4-chloroindolyl phosphate hydrolysis protein [Xanthomonas arboricola]|uniref:hypothetical protein n=1 Tax=Xanthomonas TaxID=338 RepID=UPI0015C7AF44|nr:hypothetical protein [Xanthomonas nasturtii]MCL1558686.1 hypothetical protein [Xanthomonas nasturtii]
MKKNKCEEIIWRAAFVRALSMYELKISIGLADEALAYYLDRWSGLDMNNEDMGGLSREEYAAFLKAADESERRVSSGFY